MGGAGTESFDAIVVGTGQAGKPLARALAGAGWKTAIIERAERVGGTCIVDGCTPTKTMVASARVAHVARTAREYGVDVGEMSVDMTRIRERKRAIVERFSSSARESLEEREGLELIMGAARFVGERELEVALRGGGSRRLAAERVFLNVGGRPTIPPIDGLADVHYLDSTSIMELGEAPEHLIVLGGGAIGLEFAQMFRRFGSVVTIVEMAPRILPDEDEDVSGALTEILVGEGVEILAGARATKIVAEIDGRLRVHLDGEPEAESVDGTHLLVAVGRTPNTDGLDLPATGLSPDEEGYIPVNERLETEAEGIWALGDVNGGPPFTHVAFDDYRIVRRNLLDEEEPSATAGAATPSDRILPYVIFTDPQLARVGMSESEARKAGHEIRVATLPMEKTARGLETGETRGLLKAVVDARNHQILGAAVLAFEGGEVMSALQTAMMGGLPWHELRNGIFAHPLLTESLNNLFMQLDD